MRRGAYLAIALLVLIATVPAGGRVETRRERRARKRAEKRDDSLRLAC